MPSLPSFQTLPSVVIRKVVGYITYMPNTIDYNPILDYMHIKKLYCLSHTCSLLRGIALDMLCFYCTIYIDRSTFSVSFILNNCYHLDKIKNVFNIKYVKCLSLNINYEYAIDGSALEWLNNNRDLSVFPNVTTLFIDFSSFNRSQINIASAETLNQLVLKIKSMVPLVKYVRLNINGLSNESQADWSQHTTVINGLFKDVVKQRLHLFTSSIPSTPNSCKWSTQLSFLSCQWAKNYKTIAHLLHANSKSLTTLMIQYKCYEDINRLILDENGDFFNYPNLTSLTLYGVDREIKNDVTCVESGVPFPVLEKLELDIDYIFADDLLFRGNHHTLQILIMSANDQAIPMFCEMNVFTKSKLKQLKRLILYGILEHTDDYIENNFVHILKSAPNVNSLSVADHDIATAFFPIILTNATLVEGQQRDESFKRLKKVAFSGKHLKLIEILNLIQGLPLIQFLECQILGIGLELVSMGIGRVKDMISQNYNPAGVNLRAWYIENTEIPSIAHIIACIILVASACPNLKLVYFPKLDLETAKQLTQKLLSSKLYQSCGLCITSATDLIGRIQWDINRPRL